jgi:hypothetical protein
MPSASAPTWSMYRLVNASRSHMRSRRQCFSRIRRGELDHGREPRGLGRLAYGPVRILPASHAPSQSKPRLARRCRRWPSGGGAKRTATAADIDRVLSIRPPQTHRAAAGISTSRAKGCSASGSSSARSARCTTPAGRRVLTSGAIDAGAAMTRSVGLESAPADPARPGADSKWWRRWSETANQRTTHAAGSPPRAGPSSSALDSRGGGHRARLGDGFIA